MNSIQICALHQEPTVQQENAKSEQQDFSPSCRQSNLKQISNQETYQNTFQQVKIQCDQTLLVLKDLSECITNYQTLIDQAINNQKKKISQYIKIFKQNLEQIAFLQQQEASEGQFQEQKKNIENIILSTKNQINDDLISLSIVSKTSKLFKILKNLNTNINSAQEVVNLQKPKQFDQSCNDQFSSQSSHSMDKKIHYQLMAELTCKQIEYSRAIAFNKDASIIIVGCEQFIKIFEFKQVYLKELQKLNGHTAFVSCLQFMRNSNQFISASMDGAIIIWELDQNNLWQSIQVLKGHTQIIWCIAVNQNENILISGSNDKVIKFWQRENNTWNSQQSIECSSTIYSISLNNSQDKLIASVQSNQILVIQMMEKEWKIIQILSGEYGFRLSFINQNQFVFQPRFQEFLQVFDFDSRLMKFQKGQQVKYRNKASSDDALFPIQFISQIGVMFVKHGLYVYLIKQEQNGQLAVEQSIDFRSNSIYGNVSDDGKYIASYECSDREIQIRKMIV